MSLLAASLILAGGAALPAVQRETEPAQGSRVLVPRAARIPDDPKQSQRERGRIVMSEFARCLVDRRPMQLASALAVIDSPEFGKAAVKATTDECLDSGMIQFKVVGLRGPLFVELYRRKALAEANGRVWGPPVPQIDLAMKAESPPEKQHSALLTVSHCVIQADRAGAAAIVRAPTASPQQDAAITAIKPVLSGCLPQGVQVRLGKESLEGGLAEALYRGVAPVPAPAPESAAAPGAKQ
ncbi:hypothetical protein [Sphingomonas koreensis]